MGALGLLIGPGIAGGATVLGAAFTFGGNFGGAKLILDAKVTGGFDVVDVFDTSPLVNFVVPFVVTLVNGFFIGADIGRLKGLGEPFVSGCLLTKDVRGVTFVFGVVLVNFVAVVVVLGVVGVLGDDNGVVLVKVVRGVVGVVLAVVGRDAGIVVLGVGGFGAALVTLVTFKAVAFGAVVGRTLVVGLEVEVAVVGLDNGFDVVADEVVFLRVEANVFEASGFVEADFVVVVVVVLALETVASIFLGADFLEAKLAPVTAAIAAVPTAAATAISAI